MVKTTVSIPPWYWPLCVMLPFVFLGLLFIFDQSTELDKSNRLQQARWIESESLAPPAKDDAWSNWVDMPFYMTTHPRRSSVWYEINSLELLARADNAGQLPWALYVPRPRGNVTLFVEGVLIDGGGSRLPPVAHHTGPLLFSLPGLLLDLTSTSQVPRILIHRTHMDGRATLPESYLGPANQFLADYKRLRIQHVWVPGIVLIAMLVLASIMAVLFALRRQESVYGWYALTLAFWAAYQAWGVTYAPPLENPYLWRALSYVSLGLFVTGSVFFIHRFLGRRHPRFERTILIWSVFGSALLIGLGVSNNLSYVTFGLYVWVPIANLLGIYSLVRLGIDTLSFPSTERLCLMAVTLIVVATGLRDFIWDLRVGLPGTTYYIGYAAGLVLIVFSIILMMRFARALDESENLNKHLAEEVSRRTKQIEENHIHIRKVEQASVVSRERERIMRDVHDGLGGQLVRMLSAAESDDSLQSLAPDLRRALQDLRLIIDSLAPNDGDLLSVLAAFRHHMEKDANRVGLRFIWQVQDIPILPDFGPERVLNVLRIVQECVTNTMKHGLATTITVETAYDKINGELILIFADDGRGFDVSATSGGYGIANMKRRAWAAGGKLSIQSSPRGTVTELRLPLTRGDGKQDSSSLNSSYLT